MDFAFGTGTEEPRGRPLGIRDECLHPAREILKAGAARADRKPAAEDPRKRMT